MEQVLIGAIAGAIAGGVVSGVIELVKWFLARRSQRISLQTGLYFEIDNHQITELENDQDGSPNFALTIFNETVFKNNLSTATTLLKPEFTQRLIFYYSYLNSVLQYQNMLSEMISDLKKKLAASPPERIISDVSKAGIDALSKKQEAIRGAIRLMLATAQSTREDLLSELKKDFKQDPSKIKFIGVLPKHKEWFNKVQSERVDDPDGH